MSTAKTNIRWLNFPLFIKWNITQKCNLRCKHCYLSDYTQESSLSNVNNYIDFFSQKGVSKIILLGGEPLVRNDLESIVESMVSKGISVKIATNGILATKERSQSLVKAGCFDFQISLEGHSPEINDPVRGYKTFQKILNGIAELKSAGARVTLALTISQQNYTSINEIHRLAREHGVDKLKLAAFVPIGTGKENQQKYILNKLMVECVKQDLLKLSNKYDLPIQSIFLPKKQVLQITQKNNSSTFGCGAGTTNLVLNADMSLSACDLLQEEDRTRVQARSPEELELLWQTHPLFSKWRGEEPLETTSSIASFKDVHQKGCHASNQIYQSNLFA